HPRDSRAVRAHVVPTRGSCRAEGEHCLEIRGALATARNPNVRASSVPAGLGVAFRQTLHRACHGGSGAPPCRETAGREPHGRTTGTLVLPSLRRSFLACPRADRRGAGLAARRRGSGAGATSRSAPRRTKRVEACL